MCVCSSDPKDSAGVSRIGDCVPRSRSFPCVRTPFYDSCPSQDHFGATPKPARETRALPGQIWGRGIANIHCRLRFETGHRLRDFLFARDALQTRTERGYID